MSRLKERVSVSAQIEEALITSKNDLIRVNMMLRKSDVAWLKKTVDQLNQNGARITTRSDIVRIALRELQNKAENSLLKILA